MIFDTHAHYDAHQFNADRAEVLAALPEKGVELRLLQRVENGQGPISASAVRALLHTNQPECLKALVPETTFAYLKEKELL